MTVTGARRRRAIVDFARQFGRLEVADLAERLGVALETVRRDLTELENSGVIRRSHGSVYPVDHASFESTLDFRSHQMVAERRRIAAAAHQMIGDEQRIYIDEGSTCLPVAEHLLGIQHPITVLTPSLPVAITLGNHRQIEVIMLGGELRRPTLGVTGPWATQMILALGIDLAIVGASGISVRRGLSTPNPAVSDLKATVVAQSARTVFVGDHTKFGVESFARFAHISDVDAIITDRGLSPREALRYARLGPSIDRV